MQFLLPLLTMKIVTQIQEQRHWFIESLDSAVWCRMTWYDTQEFRSQRRLSD